MSASPEKALTRVGNKKGVDKSRAIALLPPLEEPDCPVRHFTVPQTKLVKMEHVFTPDLVEKRTISPGSQNRIKNRPSRQRWEELKCDILREYAYDGRQHMMDWMKEHKGFVATWSQYSYHIYAKWNYTTRVTTPQPNIPTSSNPSSDGNETRSGTDVDDGEIEGPEGGSVKPARTVIDVARPNVTFSQEEITLLEKAADALFSLSYHEAAFQLYIMVWNHLQEYPESSSRERFIMIACARSACREPQLSIVQEILAQRQSKLFCDFDDPANAIEQFLIPMLIAGLSERQQDYAASRTHIGLAYDIIAEWKPILESRQQFIDYIDLISCCYMRSCTNRIVEDLQNPVDGLDMAEVTTLQSTMEERMEKLLEVKCFSYFLNPDYMKISEQLGLVIKDVWNWCRSRLNIAFSLPLEFYEPLMHIKDDNKSGHIILFFYLWRSFIQESDDLRYSMWWAPKSLTLGISVAELLSTIALIIKERTFEGNAKQPADKLQQTKALLKRASEAATGVLCAAPPGELAKLVLETMFETSVSSPFDGNGHFHKTRIADNLDFIQDTLKITILNPSHSVARASSISVYRHPSVGSSVYNPRLASSLRSSSMSSLRRYARGIKQGRDSGAMSLSSNRASSIIGESWVHGAGRNSDHMEELSERMSIVSMSETPAGVTAFRYSKESNRLGVVDENGKSIDNTGGYDGVSRWI